MTDAVYSAESSGVAATMPPQVLLPQPDHSVRSLPRCPPKAGWRRRYVVTLVGGDSLCAIAAVAIGWVSRFGLPSGSQFTGYVTLSAVLTLGWLLAIQLAGGYDTRAVSIGPREYHSVFRAALNLAGAAAITAYLSHMLIARTFIAIVIPAGALLQALTRLAMRRAVRARRLRGAWTNTILAVGSVDSVRHLIEVTKRYPWAGLRVVGVCIEGSTPDGTAVAGVPVLGGVEDVGEVAERIDAEIVAVAGAGLAPQRIRQLGWDLEGTGRHLVMAPGLTEVAGPRVHVRPVEGLPLMWVDQPQFTGSARLVKRAVDVVGAAMLLLLGAPVLLLIALLVRLTSPGTALYRSVRVGANGKLITVYKFRSMYAGAESQRARLVEFNEVDGGVLFKMRIDPRVTPLGRTLRKFSLDELPQLINVLRGDMSLVGPRPPLPEEVEQYNPHVHRRLLVKPGMTGLWQVNGRSDLSWDEAVRLDLYYVENWSLGFDIAIMARTLWAVIRSRGAY